ncbi:carbohydrate ABC transporter permease [Leptolyngbya sp. 15MV]|nr:carbohydrate ABC transporter permease [Leptolyngbya sp. 15MV]
MSAAPEAIRLAGAPIARGRASWLQRHRKRLGDAMTVALLLLILFPFLWLMQMSLRPNDDIFGYALRFMPTLEHYRALWTGIFPGSFVNSIVVSVSSTVLALLFGVPAAYALSRARFRRGRAIALWILATRMAPPIAFTIPFFLAYRHLGLLDTQLGLIIVYLTFNLALVIWMMQTFFEGVPVALEEAAWIDGCGVWQTFLRVSLPLSAPGLAATAVLCFILSRAAKVHEVGEVEIADEGEVDAEGVGLVELGLEDRGLDEHLRGAGVELREHLLDLLHVLFEVEDEHGGAVGELIGAVGSVVVDLEVGGPAVGLDLPALGEQRLHELGRIDRVEVVEADGAPDALAGLVGDLLQFLQGVHEDEVPALDVAVSVHVQDRVERLVERHAVEVRRDRGGDVPAREDALLALDREHLEHVDEVLVVDVEVHDEIVIDVDLGLVAAHGHRVTGLALLAVAVHIRSLGKARGGHGHAARHGALRQGDRRAGKAGQRQCQEPQGESPALRGVSIDHHGCSLIRRGARPCRPPTSCWKPWAPRPGECAAARLSFHHGVDFAPRAIAWVGLVGMAKLCRTGRHFADAAVRQRLVMDRSPVLIRNGQRSRAMPRARPPQHANRSSSCHGTTGHAAISGKISEAIG